MNSTFQQKIKKEGIFLPLLLVIIAYHVCAIVLSAFFFTWSGLVIGFGLYVITGLGITVSFHRQLTHQGFKTWRWVRWLAAFAGSLAGEGDPVQWCAIHRMHHKYSDQDGDPHSPTHGYIWSHVWWLMTPFTSTERRQQYETFVPDLLKDPGLMFLKHTYLLWHLLSMLLLYGAGHFAGGWQLGLSWLFWGYFVRVTYLLHCTWLVNSLSHISGYRLYNTTDKSRNNWLVALLAFGEGWHNNHHGEPVACNHARRWWEYLYDPSYWVIWAMSKVGLAWDLKTAGVPPK